jgi:hypothetical protein
MYTMKALPKQHPDEDDGIDRYLLYKMDDKVVNIDLTGLI